MQLFRYYIAIYIPGGESLQIPVLSPFVLPPDQDGWVGQFFGGQEYPLLWKEGEVYLLPLSEEDIGFYKAPGESEQIIIRISAHPRGQIATPYWA